MRFNKCKARTTSSTVYQLTGSRDRGDGVINLRTALLNSIVILTVCGGVAGLQCSKVERLKHNFGRSECAQQIVMSAVVPSYFKFIDLSTMCARLTALLC